MEANWVHASFLTVPTLQSAINSGRIDIWSRVEAFALSELYSRCSVLCIPSTREQFGIVAIEAMTCGTPVVATKIGGLQHIISQDFTGYLVERLNSSALATALSLFIRSPRNSEWMGRNASIFSKDTFSIEKIALDYQNLYNALLLGDNIIQNYSASENTMPLLLMQEQIATIENLINEKIIGFKDVSSSPCPSIIIKSNKRKNFVKIFQTRPASLTCLYCSVVEADSPPLHRERVRTAKRLSSISVCPNVIESDEEKGILILEYLKKMEFQSDFDAEQNMLKASSELASAIKPTKSQNECFTSKLKEVMNCNPKRIIETMDVIAGELVSSVIGGDIRLRKCHPQVELMRIKYILEENIHLAPLNFRSRVLGTIWYLLGQMDLILAPPVFAHGSMKREHLMRRQNDQSLVICDLDHASFYVGPNDIAHWVFSEYKQNENPAPEAVLLTIKRLVADKQECFLGVAWLVSIMLHRAIWRFARGNWSSYRWELLFLTALPDACRKVLTP